MRFLIIFTFSFLNLFSIDLDLSSCPPAVGKAYVYNVSLDQAKPFLSEPRCTTSQLGTRVYLKSCNSDGTVQFIWVKYEKKFPDENTSNSDFICKKTVKFYSYKSVPDNCGNGAHLNPDYTCTCDIPVKVYDSDLKICTCPSGYVDNGDTCINQPEDSCTPPVNFSEFSGTINQQTCNVDYLNSQLSSGSNEIFSSAQWQSCSNKCYVKTTRNNQSENNITTTTGSELNSTNGGGFNTDNGIENNNSQNNNDNHDINSNNSNNTLNNNDNTATTTTTTTQSNNGSSNITVNVDMPDYTDNLNDIKNSVTNIGDFMKSAMDDKRITENFDVAKNKADSTVSSLATTLNNILSNYTGSVPVFVGSGESQFSVEIFGKNIVFDLSIFERLRSFFDIFWIILLSYLNFRMYSFIIIEMLRKL